MLAGRFSYREGIIEYTNEAERLNSAQARDREYPAAG